MSCSPAMPGTPLSVINRGWGAWPTYVSAALLLLFLLLFLVPGSLFVLGESCDKGEAGGQKTQMAVFNLKFKNSSGVT